MEKKCISFFVAECLGCVPGLWLARKRLLRLDPGVLAHAGAVWGGVGGGGVGWGGAGAGAPHSLAVNFVSREKATLSASGGRTCRLVLNFLPCFCTSFREYLVLKSSIGCAKFRCGFFF